VITEKETFEEFWKRIQNYYPYISTQDRAYDFVHWVWIEGYMFGKKDENSNEIKDLD